MQTLFSIHTEHHENLGTIVTPFFACFAIWEGVGYWRGQKEKAARIDIITSEADRGVVVNLAHAIRRMNNQEAVYVTSSPVTLVDVR